MSKFTDGPLVAGRTGNFPFCVLKAVEPDEISPEVGYYPIADLRESPVPSDEKQANVRLFVEAPAMYEALKEAKRLVDLVGQYAETPSRWSFADRDGFRETARAILSRIDGE